MKIQYMKEKKKFKNYYYLSNLYIQDFKKKIKLQLILKIV